MEKGWKKDGKGTEKGLVCHMSWVFSWDPPNRKLFSNFPALQRSKASHFGAPFGGRLDPILWGVWIERAAVTCWRRGAKCSTFSNKKLVKCSKMLQEMQQWYGPTVLWWFAVRHDMIDHDILKMREADLDPVVELCTAKARRHGSSTCLPHTFIEHCNAFYIVLSTTIELYDLRPQICFTGAQGQELMPSIAKLLKSLPQQKWLCSEDWLYPQYPMAIPWLSHGPHGLVPSSLTTPRKNPWGQESKSLVLSFFWLSQLGTRRSKMWSVDHLWS